MRALCGAIIAAGAMIGLGLTAIGLGTRYAHFPYLNAENQSQFVRIKHLDTTLLTIFVLLATTLLVGLAIAIVGLMYHHARREHERLHRHHANGRATSITTTSTSESTS